MALDIPQETIENAVFGTQVLAGLRFEKCLALEYPVANQPTSPDLVAAVQGSLFSLP
jgi:hypothetical protein